MCELIDRFSLPSPSPRQNCLNPIVLWRQNELANEIFWARQSGSVTRMLPKLIITLSIIPEDLVRSRDRAAREDAHNEIRT